MYVPPALNVYKQKPATGWGLLLIKINSILKISLYSWVHFKIFPVSFGGCGLFFALIFCSTLWDSRRFFAK